VEAAESALEAVQPIEELGAPGTLRILQIREFRLLWTGAFISNAGTWLQNVALSWLVLQITHSAFWVSMVSVAQFAPILLFGLLGGVTADRFNRRRLLLITQSLMLASAAGLSVVAYMGRARLTTIMPLVALGGVAFAFNAPAFQALVPDLVSKKDLPSAISLNASQFSFSRVIGPAIGGYVVASFGAAAAFALNAVSFLAVIVALLMISVRPQEGVKRIRKDSFFGAFRAAREAPEIKVLLAIAMAVSLLSAPVIALLPVVAREVLHRGAASYGRLFAAFGVGATVGGLFAAKAVARAGYRRLLVVTGLLQAGFLVLFALSRNFGLSSVAIALFGTNYACALVSTNSGLQLSTPPRRRGRVMSLYLMAFAGLYPLGALAMGAASDKFAAPAAIAVSGALVAATALAAYPFTKILDALTP
jgi:MFS family permease